MSEFFDQEALEAIQAAREALIERASEVSEEPGGEEVDLDLALKYLREIPDTELLFLMALFGSLYLEMMQSAGRMIPIQYVQQKQKRRKQ